MNNLYNIGNLNESHKEVFETIIENEGIRIERIVTLQPYEKPGEWYDQEQDEWVILVQGEAILELEGLNSITMVRGDYILIPAHKKHRIISTSQAETCIWLAIHGNLK